MMALRLFVYATMPLESMKEVWYVVLGLAALVAALEVVLVAALEVVLVAALEVVLEAMMTGELEAMMTGELVVEILAALDLVEVIAGVSIVLGAPISVNLKGQV